MALVTMETRDDNEVCQHIAIYSLSNLCVCVCAQVCACVWADLIVLSKMRCTCMWAEGIAAQHDDQCVHQCILILGVKVSLATHVGSRPLKTF